MEPKRPSGAAFRKKRKQNVAETDKMKHTFDKWLKRNDQNTLTSAKLVTDSISEIPCGSEKYEEVSSASDEAKSLSDDDSNYEATTGNTVYTDHMQDEYCVKHDAAALALTVTVASKSAVSDMNFAQNVSSTIMPSVLRDIDLNNPESWLPITDAVRCALVESGPQQGIDADFFMSASDDGRHFSKEWFYKRLPNGEAVIRKWLIYSTAKGACFCFPCVLFAKESSYSLSRLAIAKQGVIDWKHISTIIPQHECNPAHRKCCIEWKQLEQGLKKGTAIDDEVQKAIEVEKDKWRCIIRAAVDAIMFCAKNNLALRGTTDKLDAPDRGIFLSTIDLISHYNKQIAHHIRCIEKGTSYHKVTYFSPEIQNEVIQILRRKVQCEIFSRIHKAKYFSIMFDSTPDVSHNEQVTQIIRYVHITNGGNCVIEESFIDFIETQEKTGSGLANEIIHKLDQDGLSLADCRGQSYDNGANMAGLYKGVQAQILQRNEFARFVPCAAHTLNLVGVHAAAISANMITVFGTIQTIFKFFSSSTSRWQKLMSVITISLKSHSDTRWTSRAAAVNALCQQFTAVYSLLEAMSTQRDVNADTASAASGLVKSIDFKFICLLQFWSRILTLIDRVSKALQKKNVSVLEASQMVKGLVAAIQNMRDTGSSSIFMDAKEQAESISLKQQFSNKRKRKVKRLPSEMAEDESSTLTDTQIFDMECNTVYDKLLCDLQWRFEKMSAIACDFHFLSFDFMQSTSVEVLQKHAADLAVKYPSDLDAAEFVSELESFKFQAAALMKDDIKCTPMDLLQFVHMYNLQDVYPNIEVALRLFLTLPVSVASCERSFSKLKLIKNYLRSTMGQERLCGLAVISIERDISTAINYDDVIDQFAASKARRVTLV